MALVRFVYVRLYIEHLLIRVYRLVSSYILNRACLGLLHKCNSAFGLTFTIAGFPGSNHSYRVSGSGGLSA